MFLERILLPVFCLGVKVLAEEAEVREVATDKGTNVTIPCSGLEGLPAPSVKWVHRGNHTHHEILAAFNWCNWCGTFAIGHRHGYGELRPGSLLNCDEVLIDTVSTKYYE
ncbi:hypothetical protein ACJJTC_002967 [Scirpophaga incertulas]